MSRRRLKPTESDEQICIMDWAAAYEKQDPRLQLLFAIPNGGLRQTRVDARGRKYSIEGARLKREGVKPGVPDLCLPVPRAGAHGLYIELKTKTGRASDAQRNWMMALMHQGYVVKLCRGAEEAIKAIQIYLLFPIQEE